jgi:hypothetical protein
MDLFRPGVAPAVREPVPARPLQVPHEADWSQVPRQAQRLQGCHAVRQDQVTGCSFLQCRACWCQIIPI